MWNRILKRAREIQVDPTEAQTSREPKVIGWEIGKAIAEQLEAMNKRIDKMKIQIQQTKGKYG